MAPGQGFRLLPVLAIAVSVSKSISLIFKSILAFGICILVVSILSLMRRHAGHGGQGIFISTAMLTFVEDAGWQAAADRYAAYLSAHEGRKILFWEIGVGANTPVIIKYPFWAMTAENPQAVYACLNFDEAVCPAEIKARSICIDGDSGLVLQELKRDRICS